ncbi:YhdP family protein [Guyparkeria halopsychrophila]|uniref:YhdP family phospholipid transporter n=1 Tax=Guyparkeria halopsychrophila TaxID=3139421 RepID=UPI0037CB579B
MITESSVKRERRFRLVFRRLLMAAAVLLVLIAAISAVSRALLPWVERYQPDFETVVSEALDVPVRFGSLDLRWQGYQPQVIFRDVRIDAGPRADALSLGLSWWRSLVEWRLVADKITLDAPRFTLIRDREGWSVADLSLEGRAGVNAQRVSWAEVEDQLARLGHLSVRDAVVEFRDPEGGGDRLTFSLAAELDRDRWRASGDARLAGISDEPMRFAGEGRFGEQSRVSLFLQVSDWKLPEVQQRLDRYGGPTVRRTLGGCPGDGNPARCEIGMPRIDSGRLDGQLWLDWQQTRLTDLTVQADVRHLAVTREQLLGEDDASQASLDRVSATLAWGRDAEGWHLDAEDVKVRPSREEPLPTEFVRMRAIGEDLFFATDHADLGHLSVWLAAAPLPTEFLDLLDQNVPRGQARDVRLHFIDGELVEGFLDLRGFGNTTGVLLRPVIGTRAGRGGADLTLYRQPGGWLARIEQQDLVLAVPGMFREPVSIDRLQGDLYWFDRVGSPEGEEPPAGLSLFSPNLVFTFPGLNVAGRFFYQQANGEQPGYLGVDTGFAVDDTRGIPGYLPRHVIGPRTLDWLDAALEGEGAQGRIDEGRFIFHGDPARAPFTDGGGYFSVVFDYHDLTLPYRPGWPALTEASGHMAFVNQQYHVDIAQGQVGPVPVGDSRVSIFDLDEPKLQIAVNRPVAIDALLDGLGQTPLIDAGALAGFSGRGEGQFTLDVLIGLGSGSPPPSASGTYRFAGHRLSVADGRFVFEDVSGPLRFSDINFTADALSGRFLGESFRARVDPLGDRSATRIQASTRFTPTGLATVLGQAGRAPVTEALIGSFDGATDVGVRVDVPHGEGEGGVGIRVESGLVGWQSRLPAPLAKPAPTSWPLTVDLDVRNGGLRALSARLEAAQTWRAELGFDGAGSLAKIQLGNRSLDNEPPGEGESATHRIGLTLGELAIDPWLDWWASVESSGGSTNRGTTQGETWWVDARIGRLSFGDWWLDAVTAGWSTRADGWWLGVSGEENRGELRFSAGRATAAGALEGQFDRLRLHRESTSTDSEPTPPQAWDLATLPAARFTVDSLTVDELRLGRLGVESRPENSHYRIDRVDWQPVPSLSVSGSGRVENGVSDAAQGQRTRLSLSIDGSDLGAGIAAINGYSPIQGGKVEEGQVTLAWPGSPTSFFVGRAAGNGRFLLSEGQLKGIDPGAGRLVGLMSLGALADRLRFDFRDVTREGLYFETLAGNWRLDRGRLIVDPLELINPSLNALIDGELQLVDRRLDLTARIYADFGMLLPLIGTVAGGPLVGGAVLALQETFRQLDQAPQPSVTYHIGGSFEQPEVTRGETQTP